MIIAKLLEAITSAPDEETQTMNAAAFFMLPGLLVRCYHAYKGEDGGFRVIDLLVQIRQGPRGPATVILRQGKDIRDDPKAGPCVKAPTAASRLRRISRLVKVETFSAACSQLEVLCSILAETPVPAPI
jgi:hypothetical protein